MCRRAEVSQHSVRLLLLSLDALARMPEGGCKSQRRADLIPCCPRGSCVLRVGHGQRQPWGGDAATQGEGSRESAPSSLLCAPYSILDTQDGNRRGARGRRLTSANCNDCCLTLCVHFLRPRERTQRLAEQGHVGIWVAFFFLFY